MHTASFDGVEFNAVAWVEFKERTPPITMVSIFCDQTASNPPPAVGTAGLLSFAAPDQDGNPQTLTSKHAIFRSVVRRSFGPTKPKMWQFSFFVG